MTLGNFPGRSGFGVGQYSRLSPKNDANKRRSAPADRPGPLRLRGFPAVSAKPWAETGKQTSPPPPRDPVPEPRWCSLPRDPQWPTFSGRSPTVIVGQAHVLRSQASCVGSRRHRPFPAAHPHPHPQEVPVDMPCHRVVLPGSDGVIGIPALRGLSQGGWGRISLGFSASPGFPALHPQPRQILDQVRSFLAGIFPPAAAPPPSPPLSNGLQDLQSGSTRKPPCPPPPAAAQAGPTFRTEGL